PIVSQAVNLLRGGNGRANENLPVGHDWNRSRSLVGFELSRVCVLHPYDQVHGPVLAAPLREVPLCRVLQLRWRRLPGRVDGVQRQEGQWDRGLLGCEDL